jgi:preprotein translocase subunit SecY
VILDYFNKIWKSKTLKKRIIITILIVLLFEFLSILPVPGINLEALESMQRFLEANQ